MLADATLLCPPRTVMFPFRSDILEEDLVRHVFQGVLLNKSKNPSFCLSKLRGVPSRIHTLSNVDGSVDRQLRPAKEGLALSQAPIAREAPDSRDFWSGKSQTCHAPTNPATVAYTHICKAPLPAVQAHRVQTAAHRTDCGARECLLPRASAAPRPQRSADSHLRAGAQRRDTSRACMVRGAALTRRSALFVSGCVP